MKHHVNDRFTASAQLAAMGERLGNRDGVVALGEVVDGLGRTGIGMTLLLLTLPALIPIPGPFGMVFGSIVAIISAQLIFGARRLILPFFIRTRTLPASTVKAMIAKGVPLLRWAESRLRPRRLLPLTGKIGRMALGLPILVMAIAIALPVPLGNVPPAASLIVISLGLIVRDGLAVIVGLALAVFAIGWFLLLFFFGVQIWEWVWAFVR